MSPRSRLLAGSAAVVALTWLAACVVVVANPHTERPAPADAILVLGPATAEDRLGTALDLAARGYSHTLLISQPNDAESVRQVCDHPPSGLTVLCFPPVPATTRGEARELRAQAAAHGWKTVIVVTSTYHVSRSRWILGRCFSGRLLMVPAHEGSALVTWAYQFAYQSAGYARAALQSGC